MQALSFKTQHLSEKDIQQDWFEVDVAGKKVGRICSQIANRLRGKHKTTFSPFLNCGDKIIVINSDKAEFSANKEETKVYVRHTGYPGGQRFSRPKTISSRSVVEQAIKGMLPKNRLGRALFTNLFVFEGPTHNMMAQKPKKLELL